MQLIPRETRTARFTQQGWTALGILALAIPTVVVLLWKITILPFIRNAVTRGAGPGETAPELGGLIMLMDQWTFLAALWIITALAVLKFLPPFLKEFEQETRDDPNDPNE